MCLNLLNQICLNLRYVLWVVLEIQLLPDVKRYSAFPHQDGAEWVRVLKAGSLKPRY